MTEPQFQVFECINQDCRMRFSTDLSVDHFDHCPICRSPMSKIGEPYANYQPMDQALDEVSRSLILVLDNLRSTHNVGSIFRTADGAGVKHIYCGGTTPTPEHPKIKKTSLGAESLKSWSYCPNTVQLVSDLKIAGSLILALETTPQSISLFDLPLARRDQNRPLVLILGNEISGIDPGILEIADHTLYIPMSGKKTSLNVAVSAGIALYTLQNSWKIQQKTIIEKD